MPYASRDEQRKYQREWMARRRAAFFADKSCVVCGSVGDLQLDHVDPALKITNRIWSFSELRRAAEIAKCQVLCSPCHLAKTSRNRETARDGESHPQAKLKVADVRVIRGRFDSGDRVSDIAEDLGIHHAVAWNVAHRLRWKSVA